MAKKNKQKKRSHFWVVSTHILTTGLAMPCLGALVGFVIIASVDMPVPVAFLLMLALQALGYFGGVYYSLSYIKKVAIVENPKACVTPSIITFVVLAFLGLCLNLSRYFGEEAVDLNKYVVVPSLVVFYIVVSVLFAKITKHGFASMQPEISQ